MALLKRDLYRQVEGPEVTHADRCTLVFDTDSKTQDKAGAETSAGVVGGLCPPGGKEGFAEDGRAEAQGIHKAPALRHAGRSGEEYGLTGSQAPGRDEIHSVRTTAISADCDTASR